MPIPKGFRWGVDSFMRITDIAHTDGKKTLFEFVVEKTKEIPAFWGRYIGRKDSTLQQKEIEFLRRASPSTRLLLIYNAFGINFVEDKDRKRRNPIDEFNRGTDTARAAASAADAFGAPGGVWIFVNVEPPPLGKVSSEWIRGLWDGMGKSKYEFGGIYGNTSERGNVGFIGDAYGVAIANRPGTFRPPLYAALPHRGGKADPRPANIKFGYEAGDPPGFPGAAVVWQYEVNWFPIKTADREIGRYDTDLATELAFERMWKLSPVVAPPAPQEPKESRQPREEELGIGKK